jgi:hypothetical protein
MVFSRCKLQAVKNHEMNIVKVLWDTGSVSEP